MRYRRGVLVSRFAYDSAVYGGLVAIVASAWYAIRHRERRVEPKVPQATTGRSFRRYLARIAPMIVLIAALGAEWALLSHAHDAIVVEPGPSAHRAIFIGEITARGPGDVLVVNRSEHYLKFLEVGYDEFFERYRIEPRAETKVPEVDFLGPDRQPPPDVESLRRTWLTWD